MNKEDEGFGDFWVLGERMREKFQSVGSEVRVCVSENVNIYVLQKQMPRKRN